ncbi:MAG: response regulator transcription factor [Pseudomonadota bacterium]
MSEAETLPIRLLIVDDHEVVRMGLRTLFHHVPDIEVVGEAGTVANAIAEAARLTPTVVLMDMRLPDGTGVEACREILAENPQTRILFLTSYDDQEAMLAAVFSGAGGYLLKEIGADALVQAVKSVAAGQSILNPGATKIVIERLQSLSGTDQSASKCALLSPQERRVLALVAQGKTNKEIAAALDLSDKTVKNYLGNIFDKLHVTRRAEAAAIFSRHPDR